MFVTAVLPLYPPSSRVGSWLATHGFLRALVDRGHTVVVVPLLARQFEPYDLDGVKVLPVSRLSAVLDRAHVVVSHLGDRGEGHRWAVEHDVPSVRMVHGGSLDVAGLSGAALVVCNSEATADTLVGWSGRKLVAHPVLDPAEFRTSPGDHVTLVNLSSAKGGDLFWRIARAMPALPFLGVRGGYGQQAMSRSANVELVPTTTNMRDDVYARTRLLLMPSVAETWGMVGLEAMCSGIPVLARPTPGLRESLGDAGNWQDSRDVGAWVTSIRGLLDPEGWEAASSRARMRMSKWDLAAGGVRFAEAVEALA